MCLNEPQQCRDCEIPNHTGSIPLMKLTRNSPILRHGGDGGSDTRDPKHLILEFGLAMSLCSLGPERKSRKAAHPVLARAVARSDRVSQDPSLLRKIGDFLRLGVPFILQGNCEMKKQPHTHICMYVCMHACMYVCMYRLYIYTYRYTYIHTYIHTYVHMYIYICIYRASTLEVGASSV